MSSPILTTSNITNTPVYTAKLSHCRPVSPMAPTTLALNPPAFEDVLNRMQNLTLPSHLQSLHMLRPPSSPHHSLSCFTSLMLHDNASRPTSPTGHDLDSPFPLSPFQFFQKKGLEKLPSVMDNISFKHISFEMSPTSSTSSDFDHSSSHADSPTKCTMDAFIATRSRVVRLSNVPPSAAEVFPLHNYGSKVPVPVTMWITREDYSGARSIEDGVWAVFRWHEEACAALTLSGSSVSVAPALESDLEPFNKLRRFELKTTTPHSSYLRPNSAAQLRAPPSLRMSSSASNLQSRAQDPAQEGADRHMELTANVGRNAYTISSNPPNPRTSFRLGDWICSVPSCAAHNFGRNLSCIGCGTSRSNLPPQHYASHPPARLLPSPRFVASTGYGYSPISPAQTSPPYLSAAQSPHFSPTFAQQSHQSAPKNLPTHPLLTPSGRAFASGGKVQNVSSEPMTPCVMYWPDNEPLPEQGQIRPSSLASAPQPPILNTGNRGPIEHQPGDWICLKCNYLNWRRRKVCQTCFPYAEGNGDSISAAVQAERIALLTSVLVQAQSGSPQALQNSIPLRQQGHSTAPQSARMPGNMPSLKHRGPAHRSQSHFELGAQYATTQPIYQTSAPHQQHPSHYAGGPPPQLHAPAPLLPSFLQDIVQSSTPSPTSTSSAELSFEDYDDFLPAHHPTSQLRHHQPSPNPVEHKPLSNIWRLGGDESKSFSVFALPSHRGLLGGSQNNSLERLHSQQHATA